MIDPLTPGHAPPGPCGDGEPALLLRIRPATADDAVGIARLSTQLSTQSSESQVRGRLERIARTQNACVFVAEQPEGDLVGWIQVMLLELVVSDSGAVVVGLVVDETHRKLGIGRHLVGKAEAWAKSLGCQTVVVRSREHREGAREFYERLGYEQHKVQRSFRKRLD